jgi:UDP-N-acetylmuramate--alanine ligase
MQKNLLNEAKNIFFIGIGGIGVSAVARMMFLEGKKVSGSDIAKSEIIDELQKLGIKIQIGQSSDFVPKETDLVIYSPAIMVYEPSIIEMLAKRKIKSIAYPEALHEISKDKYTIAVSGTHGKTTTTAMIAKMMLDAGLDPTVIVGSILKDQKSNFIAGKSKYFVVEACEYRKSFLNIKPTVALITNIDNDHLDFYKDIADIQNAFKEFISQVEDNGHIITDTENKTVCPILKNLRGNVINSKDFFESKLRLKTPGEHNKKNASLVLALAEILGIDKEKAKKSLEDFSGTWRRFEYKGKTKNGALIYDDYGHHPTEIKATLSGAREFFGKKKIIVAFQPHLYSRTKILLNDFAVAFKDADEVLLAPIYAAREKFDSSITSEILAEKINNTKALAFKNFAEIEERLSKNLKDGDVLITIGAGDIYKIGENILK